MKGPYLLNLIVLTEIAVWFVCLCAAEEFSVDNLWITDIHERDEPQPSFNEIDSDDPGSEFLLKWNNNQCTSSNSKKPNFQLPGVRISEAKCLEYIWEVKEEEALARRAENCKRMSGFVGITGGRTARPHEFPHMGAVGWIGKDEPWLFLCGSFLINEYFVVTAAHCQSVPEGENLTVSDRFPKIVRFGVENVYKDAKEPVDVKIIDFIQHPKYNSNKKYSDIALIRLGKRVKFNTFVRPACLWSRNVNRMNKAIISGWGVTDPALLPQTTSPHLQVAEVDIIKTKKCDANLQQKKNSSWKRLRNHQMCAIKLDDGADTCQGDSGGPMQVKLSTKTNHAIYSVIGVTSFGFGCGKTLFPSIYTKVSSFLDWIENVAWNGQLPQQNTRIWKTVKETTPRAT